MVDINAIAPPPLPAAATTPALTAIQVAVTDVSQALADLTRSIQTNATPVAVSDGGANITLTTSLGNITVTLAQQLGAAEKQNLTQQLMNLVQTQKPLTLTIQPGSPPTQAVLLLPTSSTATPAPVTNTPPPLSPTSATPLVAGNEFPAVVLPNNIAPPPLSALTTAPQILDLAPAVSAVATQPVTISSASAPVNPATLPSVQTAAPTTVANPVTQPPQIPNQQTPTPQTPPQAAQQSPSVPNQTNAQAPATIQQQPTANMQPTPQAVAPTTAPALLQPGAQVTVRVVSVLSSNETPPPLAPNQMLATVTAIGTNGNLVLKAGDTTLFVKAPASSPVGTQIIITVDPAKNTAALVIRPATTNNFPTLPQALAELAQISPQIAAQVFASSIPQPTAALPGALMFLFNAFKQGNVRGWLGEDAVETLTRFGKSELVNSLSRNLSEAGQPVQDPVVGEWKAYPIPLYAQQQFQALNLYVHSDRDARREEGAPENAAPNTVRFLIDMRLSKLGNMQVDGFVQNKKLDMVLRSEANLPDGLHNELRAAYIRAVGAVGYAGTLSFQIGRRHWMVMQPPPVKGIVT